MSNRELNSLNPQNIIDPDAPRTTRDSVASRSSSTMIAAGRPARNVLPPGISPIRENAPDDPPPPSDPKAAPQSEEFLETPLGTGRFSLYRESPMVSQKPRTILSSTESEGEVDLGEVITTIRQDVDRYVNHHDKAVDWQKCVNQEADRITKLIKKVRDSALAAVDYDTIGELRKFETCVKDAQEAWSKVVSAQVGSGQSDPVGEIGSNPVNSAEAPPPLQGQETDQVGESTPIGNDPDPTSQELADDQDDVGNRNLAREGAVAITRVLTPEEQVDLSLEGENTWVPTLETIVVLPSLSDSMKESDSEEAGFKAFDRKLNEFWKCLKASDKAKSINHSARLRVMEGHIENLRKSDRSLRTHVNHIGVQLDKLSEDVDDFKVDVNDRLNELVICSEGFDDQFNDIYLKTASLL